MVFAMRLILIGCCSSAWAGLTSSNQSSEFVHQTLSRLCRSLARGPDSRRRGGRGPGWGGGASGWGAGLWGGAFGRLQLVFLFLGQLKLDSGVWSWTGLMWSRSGSAGSTVRGVIWGQRSRTTNQNQAQRGPRTNDRGHFQTSVIKWVLNLFSFHFFFFNLQALISIIRFHISFLLLDFKLLF